MKMSNFLLPLELGTCQASRLLRAFCKGEGQEFHCGWKKWVVPLITRQVDGCTAKCKTPYSVSQVPAAARADRPALLPMGAIGDLCLGGAPGVVALAGCGQVWVSCLQMPQGEWFGSARGGLSCFRMGSGSLLSMRPEHSSSCYNNAGDSGVLGGEQSRACCMYLLCTLCCLGNVP